MKQLYKFSCFHCRVTFGKPALMDTENYSAWLAESELQHDCPNCGRSLAFMGRNFRSPSKKAIKKWQAARSLWEAGFRYVGSGSHTCPKLPVNPAAVLQFVNDHPNHTQKVCSPSSWG